MQKDPEKTVGNFNEFLSVRPQSIFFEDSVQLQTEEQKTNEQQEIIVSGISLVNSKVDEILGADNKLTSADLVLPEINFVETDPEHPSWAGYFSSYKNRIVVVIGKVGDQLSQKKVLIHEYIHFLSHNGRDDSENVAESSPIARNNNVGFRRDFGVDIRKGKEGKNTSDYFLAFNEAVTEQLAIDILPGVHETYDNYRNLLNQVVEDAITLGIGSENEGGTFHPWSREQIKGYIYGCFFSGDLDGFTKLLQTTYEKYGISEQQFGLMTHRDDLPSVIENVLITGNPAGPPPSPTEVAAMVQERLNKKTPDDYITDIIDTESKDDNHDNQIKYGQEYDTIVKEKKIVYSTTEIMGGHEYGVDSLGYIIYSGDEASSIFEAITIELDQLLLKAGRGDIDKEHITEHMDKLLFETHLISMLSEGFRGFYIYKHSKIDDL